MVIEKPEKMKCQIPKVDEGNNNKVDVDLLHRTPGELKVWRYILLKKGIIEVGGSHVYFLNLCM